MFTPKTINNLQKSPKTYEKQGFLSIYNRKSLNYLESITFGELIYKIFLIIGSSIITLILTYPEIGYLFLKESFLFENMIFPKAFVIFYIIFNIDSIRNKFKIIKGKTIKIINSLEIKKDEKQICGISIYELLNHLFEQKHFKRTDIESKFLIPRNQYQKLAEKLEEINILKRGENNSRILNEDFSREQIVKAFIYAEGNVDNLEIQHEEITPHCFTRQPLIPSLKNNIDNIA